MDGKCIGKTERGRRVFDRKIIQNDACIICQHCCRYEVIPIGQPEDNVLELAYYKGINTFWDPCVRMWFISIRRPCQYYSKRGCKIYRKYRPELCRTWMCAYPGWMQQRFMILARAGKRILKQKFGEITT